MQRITQRQYAAKACLCLTFALQSTARLGISAVSRGWIRELPESYSNVIRCNEATIPFYRFERKCTDVSRCSVGMRRPRLR